MFEFFQKFIHGSEASWIQGDQLVLKMLYPNIILFIKQGSNMIPNLLQSLRSRYVEKKIFGDRKEQETISFI